MGNKMPCSSRDGVSEAEKKPTDEDVAPVLEAPAAEAPAAEAPAAEDSEDEPSNTRKLTEGMNEKLEEVDIYLINKMKEL